MSKNVPQLDFAQIELQKFELMNVLEVFEVEIVWLESKNIPQTFGLDWKEDVHETFEIDSEWEGTEMEVKELEWENVLEEDTLEVFAIE